MNSENAQLNKFYWIELATLLPNGKMKRDKFARLNDRKLIENWREKYNNTDIFTSIQRYKAPDPDSEFIAPIYFDIDCEDNLNKARESALILCELIVKRLKIDTEQLGIFFSGNKGFHIIVPCKVFAACPSNYLLGLYKKMTVNARKQGVEAIDSNVYTHRRLWRLPNSVNRKTGQYKIPLSRKELLYLDTERMKQLSQKPRPDNSFSAVRTNKHACRWFRYALKCMENIKNKAGKNKDFTEFKQGWRIPPCIQSIQKTTLPDGSRHKAYLVLARFYSWINMHPEQIKEKLFEIDKRHPVSDPDSIHRIVKWAGEHPGFPGCGNELIQRYCQKDKCFYYQEIKRKKS